jgi:hypothetical protein
LLIASLLWTLPLFMAYKRAMRLGRIAVAGLLLLPTLTLAQDSNFSWDWRNQQVIGKTDPSLGNTPRLTETERATLIGAVALRLQKPMSEAGYDDDRIREIASTTRIRFVDLGDGKPLLFATSLGLEGGCDALGNCPLWIYRHASRGFVSLLTAITASYTVQTGNGPGELILMHHVSALQSGLEVYHYSQLKLSHVGCFNADWPKPSDDPMQLSDPAITSCEESGRKKSEQPEAQPTSPPSSESANDSATPAAPEPANAEPSAMPQPSSQAEKPLEPGSSEQPAIPDQPKESAAPESPANPEPPATTASPNEPATPAPPSEPAQPSEPANAAPNEPPASESPTNADQQKEPAPPEAPKPDEAQPAPKQDAPDAAQPAQKAEPPDTPNDSAPKAEPAQPGTADQPPDARQNGPANQNAAPEPEPAAPQQQAPPSEGQPKSGQEPGQAPGSVSPPTAPAEPPPPSQ